MKQHVLLIVDDEKSTRDALRMALQDDYEVYCAANLAQARTLLAEEPVDIVLTDLRLAGESGMVALDMAREAASKPMSIMMSAYGTVDAAVEAMKHGAYHFVNKPLNLDEVELLLRRAMRTRTLEQKNVQLEHEITAQRGMRNLLGESKVMEDVFSTIKQVAPTKTTVLLEGESGTGKELVARAIHDLSPRCDAPFVVVNCAALSAQLLESELFGHEKGAFTGAVQKRIGRFEEAHGGTLFLDEIGEIDAATQVKLLRVLSERTVERVGSNKSIHVDVRLISATNKSLSALVQEGKFREDLYFRLNVVHISMPPLRDRELDMVMLANAFLREYAEEQGNGAKKLENDAWALIKSYEWPGNVRELRAAIEHGVVMSQGEQIRGEHLPKKMQGNEVFVMTKAVNTQIELAELPTLDLSSLERMAITKAMQQAHGNKSKAAELLGVHRRTLLRKLAPGE